MQVIPNLYLGKKGYVKDNAKTIPNDYSLVVNCTNKISFFGLNDTGVPCIRIPLKDRSKKAPVMIGMLPTVINKIHETLAQDKKVLVYCRAGQQRSAAVIACYLLYADRNLQIPDAVQRIKLANPKAFSSKVRFMEALDFVVAMRQTQVSGASGAPGASGATAPVVTEEASESQDRTVCGENPTVHIKEIHPSNVS